MAATPFKGLLHGDVAFSHLVTESQSTRAHELCVMSNYFGIGLDAKIALDFNTLREQYPDKCR